MAQYVTPRSSSARQHVGTPEPADALANKSGRRALYGSANVALLPPLALSWLW